MTLQLNYFKLRGRGEPIRLALNAAGIEYVDTADDQGIDFGKMKAGAGTAEWPFGQAPTLRDGDVVIAQSDAIMRHIGRKLNMYGADLVEAAFVDMVLLGVEDIRKAYISLIYQDQLSADATKAYILKHVDPSTIHERNGGAHFEFLSKLLERNNGGNGLIVGQTLTIADIQLFDLVDLHLREVLCPVEMHKYYPLLCNHYERIRAIPGIAKYLNGPRRQAKVNGNDLG